MQYRGVILNAKIRLMSEFQRLLFGGAEAHPGCSRRQKLLVVRRSGSGTTVDASLAALAPALRLNPPSPGEIASSCTSSSPPALELGVTVQGRKSAPPRNGPGGGGGGYEWS